MGGKLIAHVISIIIVILVVLSISSNNIIDKFRPIHIEDDERITGFFALSLEDYRIYFTGWEGFLDTKEEIFRFLGPKERNSTYFYTEEDFKEIEKNKIYLHNNSKDPSEIGYLIKKPQFQPYLKLNMFVKTEKELEKAGYGFMLTGFDVYLPDGTQLINNYKKEGEKGTNYPNILTKYEIFYKGKDAIIIAGDFEYVDNFFEWEVFRPWISKQENGVFSPLYIIYIKNAELNFKEGAWQVKSKQFTGKIEDYIEQVKKDLGNR